MSFFDRLAQGIETVNDTLGQWLSWLAVAMVLVQFLVVLLRYVFGFGSILLQESILYMHGTLFMVGAGYTLHCDAHVRIDLFYRAASARRKAWVNLFGSLFLLIPLCAMIFLASYPYVMKSWAVFEGSRETSGIQGIFLLKTVILIFCLLFSLQGLALAIRSLQKIMARTA